MANIEVWKPTVSKWEGGKANHKNDHGGDTNRGITIGTWNELAPKLFGGQPTLAGLNAMTKEQWDILVRYFWDNIQGDKIKSQAVADLVADTRFHSGTGGIKWIVQPALNQFKGLNLRCDGVVGPKTLEALNNLPEKEVFTAILQARWNFLKDFIRRSEGTDKPQKQFEQGWYNRLCDFAKIYGYPNPVR